MYSVGRKFSDDEDVKSTKTLIFDFAPLRLRNRIFYLFYSNVLVRLPEASHSKVHQIHNDPATRGTLKMLVGGAGQIKITKDVEGMNHCRTLQFWYFFETAAKR